MAALKLDTNAGDMVQFNKTRNTFLLDLFNVVNVVFNFGVLLPLVLTL